MANLIASEPDELSSLMLLWDTRRRQGVEPSPAELCADRPHLFDEVAARIQIIKAGEAALGLNSAASPAVAATSAIPNTTPADGPPPSTIAVAGPPGFELLERLGIGGMGVVYKARQAGLDRVVALKMILQGKHASELVRQRFLQEAEAVALLQHPNIVQIHAMGEHEGQPYFAMEFCAGGNLADKMGEPWQGRSAARTVEVLARAVQVAHQRQIIHRDLKPANVLLDSEGVLKIADFGLARRQDREGKTLAGSIAGTPGYMAPEQAGGRTHEIGPATDVFALGAILYECLTGKPPFTGSLAEVLSHTIHEDPVRPTTRVPGVPRDLEAITLKSLHKAPEKRYASAAELADDLQRFQEGRPVAARPTGTTERFAKWVQRRPGIAFLLACVVFTGMLGVAGVVWQWREADHNADLERFHRQSADNAREIADQARQDEAAMRVQAESHARTTRHMLYLAQMNLAREAWQEGNFDRVRELVRAHLPTPGQEDLRGWEWRHLWQMSHAEERVLAGQGRWVRSLAYSPDGKQVATGSYDNKVRLWDTQTGAEGPVFQGGHEKPVHRVVFSPDGKWIASSGDDGTVRLWDPQTGTGKELYRHDAKTWALAFSPDGKRLVSADLKGQAKAYALDEGALIGAFGVSLGDECNALAFTPDGQTIVYACDKGRVVFTDAEGRNRVDRKVARASEHIFSLAITRDGLTLALGHAGGAVRLWDLRRLRITGGSALRELPSHTGEVWGLDFSRDGLRLVSASWDRRVIVWARAVGQSAAAFALFQELLGHVEAVKYAAFCPTDADRVATAGRDGTVRLWRLPIRQAALVREGEDGMEPIFPTGTAQAVLFREVTAIRGYLTEQGTNLAMDAGLERRIKQSPAALSSDGNVVALAEDGLALVDRASGKRLAHTAKPHARETVLVALSGDGKHVLSEMIEPRPELRLWRREGKELLPVGEPLGDLAATKAVIAPGGKRVALLVPDDASKARQTLEARYVGRKGAPAPVRDMSVHLWDVEGGKVLALDKGKGDVQGAAFSPDGKLLATAETHAQDDHVFGVARLWEADTGKQAAVLKGFRGGVLSVAFSADGTALAAGDSLGRVRLFAIPTGEEKFALRAGTGGEVIALAFSPTGRALAVVSMDKNKKGRLHLWPAASEAEVQAFLQRERR